MPLAVITGKCQKQYNIKRSISPMTNPMIIAAIPAYNEDTAIGSVVLRAKQYADTVIVVDDGSADATAAIAELAGAVVIRHERNLGKGMALRNIFIRAQEMNADILVCLDGDGQHNPDEIPRLLAPIKNGEADMVIGSRFLDIHNDIPRYRRAGQRVLTSLTNSIATTKVTDSQSGFRAFSKKAIDSISLEDDGIGIESYMQRAADDSGLRIAEVPITCRYDIEHASKMGSMQHGFTVLNTLLKIVEERRPLFVFGSVGFVLVIAGAALGFWVVEVYSRTGQFAIGTSLIGILLLIVGTLSVFVGLMLHTISQVLYKMQK
jgi:glycosyltransferase involved in cell wall biosynthesis